MTDRSNSGETRLKDTAKKGLYHASKNKIEGRALSAQPQAGEAHHTGEAEAD
jgi:hypothetical protein